MFKPKLPQQEQGFTLVEVLVAILITTVFVATAMQAVVIAAVFKARARQFAEATTWIQEDVESVKQRADILGVTKLTAPPTANSLSVSSTTGFSADYRVKIGTISPTLYTISGVNASTKTITVTPPLTDAQIEVTPAGTPVSVVAMDSADETLCYANASNNKDKRFGEFLSNNLPIIPPETSNTSTPNTGTKKIAGKLYTLLRTPNVRPAAPFDVLQITYKVAQGTNPPIAKFDTEVIPNAAFQCPPN